MISDIIRSKDNKIFKKINSLEIKKYRDKYGQYVVEGKKLVEEALKKGEAELVVLSQECIEEYKNNQIFKDYRDKFVFMEGKLFNKLTRTETSQGVFAIVKKQELSENEFIEKVYGKNIIVLDRLQDPGNIGTIVRTALAAGFGGCIILKGTSDVYSPKVVRAATNSLLRLPIFLSEGESQVLNIIEKLNLMSLGTEMNGVDFETVLTDNKKIALIIGNEGSGISKSLLEKMELNVKIPMSEDVESLNAAVAAGILMYKWKGI